MPSTTTAALTDAEVMSESSIFEHQGTLYYRHEDGPIFMADIYELATNASVRLRFAERIPEGAQPYELPLDSKRADRTDTWTNACDRALRRNAMA